MNGNEMTEFFVKKKKKRETARVRTKGPLKKTAKVGTLALLKQTARERTQEPLKIQLTCEMLPSSSGK